jgi:hypothetical protein
MVVNNHFQALVDLSLEQQLPVPMSLVLPFIPEQDWPIENKNSL